MNHPETHEETRCLRMDAAVAALRGAMRERLARRPRAAVAADEGGEGADPFELAELRALSCACPRCIVCREA